MTVDELKRRIESLATHILFDYHGISGGVDPFSHTNFDMWYGESYINVDSIEKVMHTPFFAGKTLEEIVSDLENIEY